MQTLKLNNIPELSLAVLLRVLWNYYTEHLAHELYSISLQRCLSSEAG